MNDIPTPTRDHDLSQHPEHALPPKPIPYFTGLLRVAIANVAALVTLLAALGFFVIQGYLVTITSMSIVNIDLRQYIVAGANFVIGFVTTMLFSWFALVPLFFVLIGGYFVYVGFQSMPSSTADEKARAKWRQRLRACYEP
jgi:hypothetical protein